MTHLQDEYLDIFGEDKDFIDGEVEDWDSEVIIQDIMKRDSGMKMSEEHLERSNWNWKK
jgi:hypothetical protein